MVDRKITGLEVAGSSPVTITFSTILPKNSKTYNIKKHIMIRSVSCSRVFRCTLLANSNSGIFTPSYDSLAKSTASVWEPSLLCLLVACLESFLGDCSLSHPLLSDYEPTTCFCFVGFNILHSLLIISSLNFGCN